MSEPIRVVMLDDHQPILDGYTFRLERTPEIAIVAALTYGERLEPTLAQQSVDVLLLDVSVPTGPENPNPYPILHLIPKLLQHYPDLAILVISMYSQRTLISAVMEAGASGYILKNDQAAIRELAAAIRIVAGGGIYLSEQAYTTLKKRPTGELNQPLSARQLEVLSLCAAYPDASTRELACTMNIANSTLRNLLSTAYIKLNVRNRAAAIAKTRQMGILSPDVPPLVI